ncbi:unnamed protein product [Chironomus riparius]|uniref:3-demethylubiquinol 3-O-methyltransferase n=1 Tax=Chironomus riparius TaxID=315576 RepID=A0A9N9S4B9_9DIPT|nr:unnamed protein product [Chironomus riparius]
MQKSEKNGTNVDEKNMKLIEETSKEWWDPYGIQIGLHAMNPLRIGFIRDGLISTGMIKAEDRNKTDVLKGIKILDVGCGAGVLTEGLGKLKAHVIGIDPSEELLNVAKDHIKGQSMNVKYIMEYIEEHSINNSDKYDAVVASEVVEHVPDPKALILEMVKCVKPNGSIFITTPNRTYISWITTIIAEQLKFLQKDSHDWNQFVTHSEVEDILKEKNCKTVSVRGTIYYPFFNKFTFFPYNGMHYFLHAVKQDSKKQK